jgi:peptidoglycan hydrolase CwlO-like protein
MPDIINFKLNNAVMMARIEEIKRNPPPEILAYKAAHPEFKTVSTALLAEYARISETTLKNLKHGKVPDSNCSTAWLVCKAFDIDANALLSLPTKTICDPATCGNHSQIRLDEKRQRVSELEAVVNDQTLQIKDLHSAIRTESRALGEAQGRINALESALKERDASIARRDAGIRLRNKVLAAMIGIYALLTLIVIIFK